MSSFDFFFLFYIRLIIFGSEEREREENKELTRVDVPIDPAYLTDLCRRLDVVKVQLQFNWTPLFLFFFFKIKRGERALIQLLFYYYQSFTNFSSKAFSLLVLMGGRKEGGRGRKNYQSITVHTAELGARSTVKSSGSRSSSSGTVLLKGGV